MADFEMKTKVSSETSTFCNNLLESAGSTNISNSSVDKVSTDSLSNDQNSAKPNFIENNGYTIGDIVWVKLGRYPFWPSIVCIDPESNTFFKWSLKDKKKFSLHVRFYNDNGRRSWANIIEKYRGKEDILSKYPNCLYFMKNSKKQLDAWNLAIKEADKWIEVDRDERMTQFCIAHNIETLTPILNKKSLENSNVVEKNAKVKENRYEVSEKLALALRPVKGEAQKKKYVAKNKKITKKQKKSFDDQESNDETNNSDEENDTNVPLIPFNPERSVPLELKRRIEKLELKEKK
ncbi:histone-lysine N-methyltransferase NSD3-like [Sipha flava]|uniref:Histone-lysine N-methyltransferase NSD3 n=1 Tax=Sipha flava TaxID=143950 RepID=A0A2S2QH36_9HEMI|nr:histone-lysine N-methyltransferase NSD3-like [Sipha flava]XP_025418262.1 histone-lysine N-methyltransferase NSD3-like [Sipha flava]XP_025418263.1 histone-lysine N-methyltransferase NSD3-like [Sipha flava]XP_025418264.1 histone-lysine N-methyltransferase NSD3-like [Sipha flava]XP_025418265.1 histone-lysine N-methyltransferase NSD3-like [Sipha flava]